MSARSLSSEPEVTPQGDWGFPGLEQRTRSERGNLSSLVALVANEGIKIPDEPTGRFLAALRNLKIETGGDFKKGLSVIMSRDFEDVRDGFFEGGDVRLDIFFYTQKLIRGEENPVNYLAALMLCEHHLRQSAGFLSRDARGYSEAQQNLFEAWKHEGLDQTEEITLATDELRDATENLLNEDTLITYWHSARAYCWVTGKLSEKLRL